MILRTIKRSAFVAVLLILLSCSHESSITDRLDRIKEVGDSNPTLALEMLDSLSIQIHEQSSSVQNKYYLTKLRMQDKAYIPAKSDLIAKQLLTYYEKHGNAAELQETYYYAGSVYRDLQDTPRALTYFFKAAELAETDASLDSLMLRNTYSNLSFLFYVVQDYTNALIYAKKEHVIARALNKVTLNSMMHLGTTFAALDSTKLAEEVYAQTLDTIKAMPQMTDETTTLCLLLHSLASQKDTIHSTECFRLIENKHVEDTTDLKCYAYAEYYNLIGKVDSATYYYNIVLENKNDWLKMYDASKTLFYLYDKRGQSAEALRYVREYIKISDSIDLGKRQELAATVNNEFQYHRDKNEEQRMMNENEQFRTWLFLALAAIIVGSLLVVVGAFYRRNRHLKELLQMSNELDKQIDAKKKLQMEIEARKNELDESRERLEKSERDLEKVKTQLQAANAELTQYDERMQATEQLLSERMAQNQTFLNLLHQSELAGHAEDIVHAIRQTANGKKNMKDADWKQLYQAVDEIYPTFKDQLLKELGSFTEQQMKVCYLMRIGLSNSQIQHMTNMSRATVWRWTKKYRWIQTQNLN